MPEIKTLEDLNRIRENAIQKRQQNKATGLVQITVEMGTPSIAAGARKTLHAIQDYIKAHQLADTSVRQTGDSGLDSWEPIIHVGIGNQTQVTYIKVTPLAAIRIMEEHVVGGKVVEEYLIQPY